MSLTTTAPLSLPPHAALDRPHTSSMSYPPADDRTYPGYYSRPAPGSAHGAPPPPPQPQPEAPSPERLHSAGGPGAAYAKAALPQSPSQVYPPHDIGPAPGSSHGYPAPNLAASMSGSAGYPPQPPQAPAPYYGVMPGQNQDPNITSPPSTANSRSGAPPAGATNYTVDGAPIVPVGISGGKMFRCRGFGDCDKVFTRSEHLARHVRKHTGERPFPCHCGKAFSRLDNLRQHAATVHADQTHLNETMLSTLATVHAALSQQANREQRRRGEVVEVPKNAVERPRGERGNKGANPAAVPPAGAVYAPPGYHPHQQWGGPPPHDARPRTAESWMGYPSYVPGVPGEQHPPGTAGSVGYVDDAGPSRRPPSAGYPHAGYYSEPPPPPSSHGRPATANAPPGTAGSGYGTADDSSYRPVSSNGREIPVPGHYADSEPPTSAHGPPPHSPMYPHSGTATVPATGNWTSPPHHPGYPPADPSMYPQGAVPPAEGQQHPYPPGHPQDGSYGPPPPGSSGGYYYPPQQGHGYYGQQSPAHQQQATFPSAVPPGGAPPPAGAYPPNYNAPPGDSPFQYNAGGPYPYPAGYDGRKRRAEDEVGGERKHSRNSTDGAPSDQPRQPGPHGELWLPPASERRSSLAISALLGSPQQDTHSSRPNTGDVPNRPGYAYAGAPVQYDDRAGGAPLAGGVPRERPGNPADEKKILVAE